MRDRQRVPEQFEEKVPFWKKEISLKRKPAAKRPVTESGPVEAAPGPEHEPQAKKEPKAKEPRASKERKPRQPKGDRKSGSRRVGKKRLVGLTVGSSHVAAARVANNGSPELVQVAREPLEHGIVVAGELREPDALANVLRAFFKKHKLPKKGVRLGLANNRIGVRTFEISGIADPKQLTNAIRFRAQEALPIPIDEAVLDYQILSERPDEAGGVTRRVLLVVAYRELVDRYLAACRKAGIKLAGIDLEAFGALRALSEPREAPAGTAPAATVVVSLGHDRSTFAVSDGRLCEFTRVLEWGGSSLDIAIARALDLAPSQAEPIKLGLSLREPVIPAGLTQEHADSARQAVERELHAFARELVSSLQFYQSQPGSLGIGEIVLTGGTAQLPGLDAELRRLIGVPVRVGDPLVRVTVGKRLKHRDDLTPFATAIGLGIED